MIYLKPKLIVSVFEKAILRREVPFALDRYAVLPGEHLMAVKHDSPLEIRAGTVRGEKKRRLRGL